PAFSFDARGYLCQRQRAVHRPRYALKAQPAKQAAKAIANHTVQFDTEFGLAACRHGFEPLRLSGQHRGPADKLALAFRKNGLPAKVGRYVVDQVPEPPCRDTAPVRKRQKLASVCHPASMSRLADGSRRGGFS